MADESAGRQSAAPRHPLGTRQERPQRRLRRIAGPRPRVPGAGPRRGRGAFRGGLLLSSCQRVDGRSVARHAFARRDRHDRPGPADRAQVAPCPGPPPGLDGESRDPRRGPRGRHLHGHLLEGCAHLAGYVRDPRGPPLSDPSGGAQDRIRRGVQAGPVPPRGRRPGPPRRQYRVPRAHDGFTGRAGGRYPRRRRRGPRGAQDDPPAGRAVPAGPRARARRGARRGRVRRRHPQHREGRSGHLRRPRPALRRRRGGATALPFHRERPGGARRADAAPLRQGQR